MQLKLVTSALTAYLASGALAYAVQWTDFPTTTDICDPPKGALTTCETSDKVLCVPVYDFHRACSCGPNPGDRGACSLTFIIPHLYLDGGKFKCTLMDVPNGNVTVKWNARCDPLHAHLNLGGLKSPFNITLSTTYGQDAGIMFTVNSGGYKRKWRALNLVNPNRFCEEAKPARGFYVRFGLS